MDLRFGAVGAEVGNLQRFLNGQAIGGMNGAPLIPDEVFGPNTAFALSAWQKSMGLPRREFVDAACRQALREAGFIPFIHAKNYTALFPKVRDAPDWIVMHVMESSEKPGTAEQVGVWFAGKTVYPTPKASAHYGVDPDGVWQYVRETDVAWHAPGANARGIGIELAGRAGQSADDWHDAASEKLLFHAAKLVAKLSKRWTIPLVKLAPADLAGGKLAGVCGHVDVTKAFPHLKGTHWDPGPNFPWAEFLALAAQV